VIVSVARSMAAGSCLLSASLLLRRRCPLCYPPHRAIQSTRSRRTVPWHLKSSQHQHHHHGAARSHECHEREPARYHMCACACVNPCCCCSCIFFSSIPQGIGFPNVVIGASGATVAAIGAYLDPRYRGFRVAAIGWGAAVVGYAAYSAYLDFTQPPPPPPVASAQPQAPSERQ